MHKSRFSSTTINNACSKDSSSSSIRRKLSFFSPMSVTPLDTTPPYNHQHDDVDQPQQHLNADDNAASCYAEKLLPNGDFYSGEWLDGVPHGSGKYLWTDGCMYEGQWRHGNTAGRGRFSWPSGATYEGEFKSGFMHGEGTYTGADGDTYRGSWSMNLKHGSGEKSFANGDYYNGDWRSGLQHGHGRYVWRNGNEYNGSWRDGKIHGKGTLIWANGNRYDGGWEDGMPSGSGSFRWADGSLYIGFWSREPASPLKKKGVYYASPAASSPTARDPRDMFSEALDDCKVCGGENVSILPSQKIIKYNYGDELRLVRRVSLNGNDSNNQEKKRPERGRNNKTTIGTGGGGGGGDERGFDKICIWESDGGNNDITCDIVDGNEVITKTEESIGEVFEQSSRVLRSPPHMKWPPKEPKKQGITISKGHKNYELMLNLQLGIR